MSIVSPEVNITNALIIVIVQLIADFISSVKSTAVILSVSNYQFQNFGPTAKVFLAKLAVILGFSVFFSICSQLRPRWSSLSRLLMSKSDNFSSCTFD
jgi:predicted butyrate kinase (DUF1464 family)